MRPTPMTRLQRLTYRVWLAVGVTVLLAVSLYLAYRPLAIVLAPVLLALLIVYLLNPIVEQFARWRVPRLLGTALTYLLVIGGLVGLVVLVMPMLSRQFTEFAAEVPDLGEAFVEGVKGIGQRFGVDLQVSPFVDTEQVALQLQEFLTEAENRDTVLAVLGGLSGVARGAFFVLLTLLIGPVVAFYILVDLPRFRAMLIRLVPPTHREEVIAVGQKLTRVVGGFVRGQLVIAAFVGVASSIALGILGVPFWLVLGVIAGVTNLVPLLGPWVAGILAVSVALFTEGFGFAVLVALAMAAIQQIDSNVLSPLIMGRTVRIHPLVVLLGVLVAGAMYGIFGMLVIVPLLAGAKTLAQHLWQTRVPWAEGDAGLAEGEGGIGRAAPEELARAGGEDRPRARAGDVPGRADGHGAEGNGGDTSREDAPGEGTSGEDTPGEGTSGEGTTAGEVTRPVGTPSPSPSPSTRR